MKKRELAALLLAFILLFSACAAKTDKNSDTSNLPEKTEAPEEIEETEDTEKSQPSEDSGELYVSTQNFGFDLDMISYLYLSDLYYFNENYGSFLGYMAPSQVTPDMNVSLSTQYYDNGTESGTAQTWHDYFLGLTVDNMKTYLCYAEEALAAGFEYPERDNDVTTYMQDLKDAAEEASLPFDEYLAEYYGENIDEEDIREALGIYFYGIMYYETIKVETEEAITDEELEAYKPEDADESPTKDVGHILITPDEYGSDEAALAKAEEVLAEYHSGTEGAEYFEELSAQYTADGNCFYYNVTQGQMVTEFNDWIFDEARQPGDTDIVKTEYGYHIMYFVGEGVPSWRAEAAESVLQEKIESYTAELKTKYEDTFLTKDELFSNIPDHLPEVKSQTDTEVEE